MVKYFKGQVKVSDIQEAFDNILNTINSKITEYNNLVDSLDIDFNVGSEELGLLRHTLSVGGLKRVLDLYNGHILGAQLFRVSNNQYLVSEGLYIKDRQVLKLPSKVIVGTGDGLYFDTENQDYTLNPESYQPGEWQVVEVPYTSPAISGSDTSSLGTITAPNMQVVRMDLETPVYPYTMFKNNQSDYALSPDGSTYTLTWQFTEPLALTSINLDYTGYDRATLTITNLNDDVLASDSDTFGGDAQVKNVTLTFADQATQYEGIKIKLYSPDRTSSIPYSAFYVFYLGNIQLNGKKIESSFIPTPGAQENLVKLCDINNNRISKLCNTQPVFNEAIPDFIMKVESKALGSEVNETLDNSQKGQFIGGVAGRNGNMTLLGTQVSFHTWHGDSVDSYWEPFNYLFVPKGVANPYVWVGGEARFKSQKVWNYILTRPQR